MDKITLCRLVQKTFFNIFRYSPLINKNNIAPMGSAVPKANTVDFENWVLGSDLKGFISSKTPIDAMQSFRSPSRTPYLKNGTGRSEQWDRLVLRGGA